MNKIKQFMLIVILFACLLNNQVAKGQDLKAVIKKAFPSVVRIIMKDNNAQPISVGTGFFIDKNIVATNYHVINKGEDGYINFIGKKNEYRISSVIGVDELNDLALLKVDSISGPPMQLGSVTKTEIGDDIYVVGNPYGVLEGTVSKGIISGIRDIGDRKILQIDAAISAGSSGGPVIDITGKVIGVAFASFKEGQNLNFAIPVRYVIELGKNKKPGQSISSINSNYREAEDSIASNYGSAGGEDVIGELPENIVNFGGVPIRVKSTVIRNNLNVSITNIKYRKIYYNSSNSVINFTDGIYQGTIPPGLAKTISDWDTTSAGVEYVEMRILDFKIANENE